jgi:hypothetical protein
MGVPRVSEDLGRDAAVSLLSLVSARIDENWFGEQFPKECEDGGHNAGYEIEKLRNAIAGYKLIWPQDWPDGEGQIPADNQIFDLLEFGAPETLRFS